MTPKLPTANDDGGVWRRMGEQPWLTAADLGRDAVECQARSSEQLKMARAREPHWFDEQRLIIDRKTKPISLDNAMAAGFDRAPPKR